MSRAEPRIALGGAPVLPPEPPVTLLLPLSHAPIHLKDLTIRRSGREALSRLTLTLTEHRIGIVGRNGSGKSTLARAIAGLETPVAGSLSVAGVDPARDRRSAVGRIGLLFQNSDHQIFLPTVSEEICFGLVQQGMTRSEARDRAGAVLARNGRADWADRPVAMLSEGQRRFLCLMAVLAMEPDVIMLDEPFNGLDLPTTWQLESWLATLSQQVILITHDPERLAGYDRAIWLEAGAVAGDGPPDGVLPAYLGEMRKVSAT